MLPPLVKFDSRQLAVLLSVLLLLKTSLSFSQDDNFIGYRREFYQEDDNRMSINTDTVGWDMKLNEHVSVNGEFVHDAISGATPTGAPPQAQWSFAPFSSYYQQAYNQFFQNAIAQNYSFYQNGYFPNYQAFTNWVAQTNPQLSGQATNSAAQSYNSLTNSPNFHNSKNVPLTTLHDTRFAFFAGSAANLWHQHLHAADRL